jgi:chemotaxis protein methyltransferase CheR
MSINSSDFDYIRKIVRDRTGVLLADDKTYLVESRLNRIAKDNGVKSISGLVAKLRQQPLNGLSEVAIEALMTNETFFYRDEHPFNALKTHILPELLLKRETTKTLNIWCAACSSGQEPYSIAMLLQEEFPQLATWNTRLVASDISTAILDRARTGIYAQHEVNRGLSPTLLNQYFKPIDNGWQIEKKIRRMVEFRQMNLTDSYLPLAQIDIIFLRNVLIYFDVETKRSILAKVKRILQPDGYLFLGGGETTLNVDDAFEPVQFDKAVCYRLR